MLVQPRLPLHPELVEIEFALDRAEGLVVDLAAAKLDDGGSLGADDPALDLLVLDTLLVPFGGLVRIIGRDVAGPTSQAWFDAVDEPGKGPAPASPWAARPSAAGPRILQP